jgi:2-amino-4-hydroxy-6-hydroxymethyldihydropteridine diphosphokinase
MIKSDASAPPLASAADTPARSGERVFLGIGGNLGDRLATMRQGLAHVHTTLPVLRCSAFYETPPWGILEQPSFLNFVVEISTGEPPLEVLDRVLAIEERMGRHRVQKWGPRLIDIDILAYGQRQLEHPRLKLPHPYLHERGFVLLPWSEIAPAFHVPGYRQTVGKLLQALQQEDAAAVQQLRLMRV